MLDFHEDLYLWIGCGGVLLVTVLVFLAGFCLASFLF